MSDHDGTPRGDAAEEAYLRRQVLRSSLGYPADPEDVDQDGYLFNGRRSEVIRCLSKPGWLEPLCEGWACNDGGWQGHPEHRDELDQLKGWQP